jgi:hypothetical protein
MSAADGIAAGARVSVLRKGGQRVWRGNVVHQDTDTVTVRFDDGRTETLHRTRATIEEISAKEHDARRAVIGKARLGHDNIRVRLEQAPKHYTLRDAGVKRDWRGTIIAIHDDYRLTVKFDRADKEVIVDPLVDRLKNITGEERAARRRKALERFTPPLERGQRIELDECGTDEPLLQPGMRGTITSIDSGWSVGVEWDNGRFFGLLPDVDRFHRLDKE